MAYEYRREPVPDADLEAVCNEQGAEGFRLVRCSQMLSGRYDCLFEREVNGPAHQALVVQGSEGQALRTMIANGLGVDMVSPNDVAGIDP